MTLAVTLPPCTDSPLFTLDNVVVTPHLGASTDEAQEKAGVAVAKSVRLALAIVLSAYAHIISRKDA